MLWIEFIALKGIDMVVLREMRQEEYSAYCQYFIDAFLAPLAP